MKKLIIFIALLPFHLCFGQDPVQQVMDTMFSTLNYNYVTTGYLYDKTIHYSDFEFYDGSGDSVCSSDELRKVWQEFI